AKDMRVIGVTGTNGKTTTCFMIHKMLRQAGYNVALMTTVAYGVNDDIKSQKSHVTTLSSPELNRRLADMRQQGAEWLILETTSHALAQNRTWGIPFEIAVLTNVTHEHLDYHGTFEKYAQAKRKMFKLASKNPKGYAVVNADDPLGEDFLQTTGRGVSYGIDKGELRAEKLKLASDGSSYVAKIDDETYQISCHLPGKFNVSNSLATIAVGRHLGLSVEQVEQGIAKLESVEGRMVNLKAGQDFNVVIDFAHTPDSFEKLLSDLRQTTKGKLVVLFGSAGRRDESKRRAQGEIAGKYADELVLTEEDDRDIDGQLILDQIAEGAERSGKQRDKDMFLVLNRSEAIQFAMTRTQSPDDTIVLLGKGHEKTIERADGEHPWDETEEAKKAIKRLNN
ncbi:hypothetical protein CR956_01885, partial [Candidatus Saccharibacteria bacterium]